MEEPIIRGNSSEEPDLLNERLRGADIAILPSWRDGSVGVYREQLISLAKALRSEGVRVEWLDEAENRVWYGERSAVSDAIIAVGLGILTNAGWDAVKFVFGRKKDSVKLRMGYRKREDEVRWIEFEGSSADIPSLLDKAIPWSDGPEEIENPDRRGRREEGS